MKKDTQALIAEYVRTAIRHGEALEAGNHRGANKDNARLVLIFNRLNEVGEGTRLLDLLEHQNPSVRCWAAVQAFQLAPIRAEKVLEAIARELSGPLSLMAEIDLTELRKGMKLQ